MNRHDRETGPQDLVAAARAAGVTYPRVLEAIRHTPRAAFGPVAVTWAYDDAPIPIPDQQVTTQLSLSAAMIAALGLTGDGTDGAQDCPVRRDRGLRRLLTGRPPLQLSQVRGQAVLAVMFTPLAAGFVLLCAGLLVHAVLGRRRLAA